MSTKSSSIIVLPAKSGGYWVERLYVNEAGLDTVERFGPFPTKKRAKMFKYWAQVEEMQRCALASYMYLEGVSEKLACAK